MLTLLGIGDSNVAQQQREAGNSKANNEESSPSQSFTFLGGSKSEIVELKSENSREAEAIFDKITTRPLTFFSSICSSR